MKEINMESMTSAGTDQLALEGLQHAGVSEEKQPGYRVCTRCVMDTSHDEIEFDEDGVCNFCRGYSIVAGMNPTPAQSQVILDQAITRIKASGAGRDYDCILGLSGGVDSSYTALKLSEWGLRTLAVQFDNGWNSELASHNIEMVCRKLGIDLFTYVVDWEEFRDLTLSFLRAGLANVEAPSDNGIMGCIYRTAVEKRIPYLVTGINHATECYHAVGEKAGHVFSYGYTAADLYHIKAVHRRFGKAPLKTFPGMGLYQRLWIEKTRLKRFDPLNFIPYNKETAIRELEEKTGWRPYPGKHSESIITRFHQAYILPRKFRKDKRQLHLSNLIWSEQLNREDALRELEQPLCQPDLLAQDKEFVLKKLRISDLDLEDIMSEEPRNYTDYPNLHWLYSRNALFFKLGGKLWHWGKRRRLS
jgi:N-acetyl sugar amidotransferase